MKKLRRVKMDRIEVVRCQECIHWKHEFEDSDFGYCQCRFGTCENIKTDAMFFCADGEEEYR